MKRLLAITLLLTVSVEADEHLMTGRDAKAVFGRLKALAGSWRAKSSKEWTGTATYEVAARGSAVIFRSRFDGESNDGMLSVYFMDGDRLLLTHYCEAKNQPTLMASTIDDETQTVTFRFVSGTNMASRNVGHMDTCVIHFISDDQVVRRWSWFADGRETWMEAIEEVRAR